MIGKILEVLERRERWQLARLMVAVLGMGIVQMVSVAAVMPFMGLVADPRLATDHPRISPFYHWSGAATPQQFLIGVGAGVLALMVVGNLYSAFTTRALLRFVWSCHHQLTLRLLESYLGRPYPFFLTRNTSDLSKNLLAEVFTAVSGLFMPVALAFSKGAIALCVVGLLFAVNPMLALGVAVAFGGAYSLIYAVIKKREGELGQQRLRSNELRYKIAAEAFGGIKDVKVLGAEDEFLRRFSGPSKRFSDAMAANQLVSELPRFAMETLAFGGLIVMVLYLLAQRQDFAEILPLLSLYALAGYRLMPALQQIFKSLTQMRFSVAALDALRADLAAREPRPGAAAAPALAFRDRVELRDVSFSYSREAGRSLHGIGIEIRKNQKIAFVGSTGSGKTTLVDLILALLTPTAGELRVDGVPVTPHNADEWRRHIGYVPQQIFLSDDSIARNIAFGVPEEEIDHAAVERAARMANLLHFVDSLPEGLGTQVGERGVRLSGGQRQRIGIARALYRDPALLILDEATSALDGLTENAVMEAIHTLSGAKTIVMIAHRLTTVRECDVIYLLEGGRIAASGTYDELVESSGHFRAMAAGSDWSASDGADPVFDGPPAYPLSSTSA